MLKLILYTKSKCHLCDEMKDVLNKVRDEFNFDLNEIDIESDAKLFEKFKEKIPVLIIKDKMYAKYKLDEGKLRKKLNSLTK